MVEESRLNILSRKTLLVLGPGFQINAGDLGQMEADVEIEGVKVLSEELDSDLRLFNVRIIETIRVHGNNKRNYSLRTDIEEQSNRPVGYPKNVFSIPENKFPNMDERDIGKKLRVIINFKVVEETTRYTLLKVNSMFLVPKQDMSMRIHK